MHWFPKHIIPMRRQSPTSRAKTSKAALPHRLAGSLAIATLSVMLLAGCSTDDSASSSASSQDADGLIEPSAQEVAAEVTLPASGVAFGNLTPNTATDTPKNATGRDTGRREVVYTANAEVEVRDAVAEAIQLRKSVTTSGGWVLTDERFESSARLVLKVPPTLFDATLASLTKVGKVRSQTITAADVTADMVDLEARLRTAQISRDRLRALLNGATKMEDIISLEAELGVRETSVEQLTGQLEVLRNQVGYATIDVRLYERSVAGVDDTRTTPAEGFARGWVALRQTAEALVVALATVAVWTPFAVLSLFFARRWRKRRHDRRQTSGGHRPMWSPPSPVPGPNAGPAADDPIPASGFPPADAH